MAIQILDTELLSEFIDIIISHVTNIVGPLDSERRIRLKSTAYPFDGYDLRSLNKKRIISADINLIERSVSDANNH